MRPPDRLPSGRLSRVFAGQEKKPADRSGKTVRNVPQPETFRTSRPVITTADNPTSGRPVLPEERSMSLKRRIALVYSKNGDF